MTEVEGMGLARGCAPLQLGVWGLPAETLLKFDIYVSVIASIIL